ncbi:MAG: hypothetical protein IPM46_04975 [Flavobacteriales bacterium]|nr:hypothetical protein [Flavobacteriales bacterium]
MRLAIILFLLTAAAVRAQYNGPESVEYDPVGDRYFVSNTTGSVIKVRSQSGTVSDFVAVSPAPYGLEIMGDVLFACSGGSVKGYSLNDASLVFNRSLGGTFLNGIATDGTYLYVTDFSATRIYKVDVAGNSHTTLVANTSGTPNGIVHVPGTDLLLVAFWGSNAAVKAYDRNSGANLGSVSTTLTNIDGITIDCLGRVLLASWSPDRITAFEWGIISPTFTDLLVPGLNNPADIDFDFVNDRICIPNSGSNTVTLFDISCNTGVTEAPVVELLRAIPNPTAGVVRIEPPLSRDEAYILLDGRGLLVGGGTIRCGALLDIGRLPSGAYTIEFTRTGQRLRVVKE